MLNVKKYIKIARPFTLGHTLIIALMYCLIAGYDFRTAVLATFAMIAIHTSAQMTNLLKDIAIDMINKPWRPTVTGEIKKYRAIIFDLVCVKLALVAALFVGIHFFTWMLVLWFFAWSFSILPVRKNQFTHVFWMATTRGFIPAYMITANLPLAILMWLWNFAFNPVKDYKDVEGDLKFGIKTIMNQYGKNGLAFWLYSGAVSFYITLTIFCLLELLPIKALIAIFTLPIAIAIPSSLDEPPAFSDNNMAYDLYWFGFTLNAVFFAVAFLS